MTHNKTVDVQKALEACDKIELLEWIEAAINECALEEQISSLKKWREIKVIIEAALQTSAASEVGEVPDGYAHSPTLANAYQLGYAAALSRKPVEDAPVNTEPCGWVSVFCGPSRLRGREVFFNEGRERPTDFCRNPDYIYPVYDTKTATKKPTCILRKEKPRSWVWLSPSFDTVICGLDIAEQYLRQGYQFDWKATDAARSAADQLKPEKTGDE